MFNNQIKNTSPNFTSDVLMIEDAIYFIGNDYDKFFHNDISTGKNSIKIKSFFYFYYDF